ncbi:D-alanyl-D-alanine carboxypeptidase [Streptococcus suis]|uniref:DUF1958 domain-containing protein n=1 Tax=Streptococcus suivaginalis TaxID=3028082 RepID=A0AA96VC96_9STRE|nr:DUF1958 domain-containing protein [Streptococcus sp. 29896]MCK4027241.1 D-alanyl-D-alanine carboxypeptidase [Streptococcus suis]WNY46586.1 DUF1958 domain-containing protein [Streptococcus sp. 29896]
MKKFILLSCVFLLSIFSPSVRADELLDLTRAEGYEVSDINRPKSSIVIDAHTGTIVWQDNVDEVRDPASMSKVLTLYMTYQAIEAGTISEDTLVRATESDQAIAGIYAISNNAIVAGVDYTVSELITMTAVPSSNVATIMLANLLSNNDPDAFMDQMNAVSQELGMTNSYWFNPSGAAASSFEGYYNPTRYDLYSANQTTARDMAILTYHFLKDYPEILEHTKHPVVTVKAGTPYEETFETYNYSLPGALYGIEGVDGLKTGSSPRGAFNYIATVNRNGQRFITVIMGVGSWEDQNGEYYRHPFGNALMEKAYAEFDYQKVLAAGQQEVDGQVVNLEADLYATVPKGSSPNLSIADGRVVLDTGLEQVSPMIAAGQAVEVVSNSASSGTSSQTETQATLASGMLDQVKQWLAYWPWLLILIFLILMGMLHHVLNRNRRKRKQSQESGQRSRRNRRR